MRVIFCLCLTACQFAHGQATGVTQDGAPIDDGTTGSDATRDAAIDARSIDGPATAALCSNGTPRINEQFSAAPACPLGVMGGAASMVLFNGTLQISTNTNGQNAYCNEPNLGSWSGNGATIEVPSVMTGNNAWTSFQVLGINHAITAKNGVLVYTDNAGATTFSMVAYNAANMRWWRLRPDASDTNVIAEYSANRTTWTMLGTHPGSGMIRVQMIAGTDGSASPSGASAYDNLVVCP